MRKSYIFLLAVFIAMSIPALLSQRALWYEDFEGLVHGSLPDDWTQEPDNGTNRWFVENQNLQHPGSALSGKGRVRFSTQQNGTPQKVMLITRPENLSRLNDGILVFSYSITPIGGRADSLKVYFRLDEYDEWEHIETYGPSEDYTTVTLELARYRGLAFQVGFEGIANANPAHGVVIDDVYITKKPSCPKPTGINFYNVIHDSVKMSWTGAAEIFYMVKIAESPLSNPSLDTGVFQSRRVGVSNTGFSGLKSDKVYYYYIRSECEYDDNSEWVSGTFKTACDPVTSIETDFDSPGDLYCWETRVVANGKIPGNAPYNVIPDTIYWHGRTCYYQSEWAFNPWTGREELFESDCRDTVSRNGVSSLQMPVLTVDSIATRVTAVSPRLADGVNLRDKQLEFWASTPTTVINLKVMAMEWPDDFATAKDAGTVSFKTTYNYEKFVITFDNVSPNARYFAFYIDGNETPGNHTQMLRVSIDDLVLKDLEICSEQSKVYMFNDPVLSENKADLAWNTAGAGLWHLKISTNSINPELDDASVFDSIIDTPGFLVEELIAGTPYFYYVKPICEEGVLEGAWSVEQTFQTNCPAGGYPTPYMENFDKLAVGTMPPCWTFNNLGGNPSYIPKVSDRYPYSDPHLLSIYNYNQTLYMALPKMAGNINEMQLRFKLAHQASILTPIEVGVMDDPLDDVTFQRIQTVYIDQASTTINNVWHSYKVVFNKYEGKGKYIAIKVSAQTTFVFDDFVVEMITLCEDPENVEVIATTPTSITIDWTPMDVETKWDVIWGVSGFILSDDLEYVETGEIPYTIEGLKENVTYDIYIRSVCPTGNKSSWIGPLTAKTIRPATVPYDCDFEDVTMSNSWVYINGTQVNQWISKNAVASSGSRSLYISNDYGVSNKYSAENTFSYVYRTFELEEGIYDFKFNYRVPGNTQHLSAFLIPADTQIRAGVLYGKTTYDLGDLVYPDGWIVVTDRVLRNQPDWEEYSKTLQLDEAGRYNLLFVWKTNTSANTTYDAAAVDDVFVDINEDTCLTPENIRVSNIRQESALLHYTSYNALAWRLIISEEELSDPESAVISDEGVVFDDIINSTSTGAHTYLMEDLDPAVSYYVYLRADCSTNSPWTSTSFNTICDPIDVPVREDFDLTDKRKLPTCWRELLTGYSAYVNSPFDTIMSVNQVTNDTSYRYLPNYPGNTTNVLQFYYNNAGSIVIMPEIETDINQLQMSFKLMNKQNYTSNPLVLEIGVITDASDEESFEIVETVVPKVANQWKSFTVLMDEYTGTGKQIAFRINQLNKNMSGNLYMDDLVIDSIKGCVSPREITMKSLSSTSAEFSWRTLGNPATYRVKVCSSPQTRWEDKGDFFDGEVTGNSVTVTELFPAMDYYVYVRTICEEEDDTDFSYAYSYHQFTTDCGEKTSLPYFEDFDRYEMYSYPSCWTEIIGPVGQKSGIYVGYANAEGGSDNSIGSAYLHIAGDNYVDGLIAMPEFDANIKDLKLRFKALGMGTTEGLVVGLVSDLNKLEESFDEVYRVQLALNYVWEDVQVSFENYNGNGKYIAFFMPMHASFPDVFYIDDVYVTDRKVSCTDISTIIVNKVTDNSATVSWVGNSSVNDYQIKVSKKMIDPEVQNGDFLPAEDIKGVSTQLTGLDPNTNYFIYVRSRCGNSYGYWSKGEEFTTQCSGSLPMPYEENFDQYGEIEDFGYFPECWNYRVEVFGDMTTVKQTFPYIEIEENSLVIKAAFDKNDSVYAVVDVITPRLALPENGYQMTFKMRSDVADAMMYIGTLSDPSDATTFKKYDSVSVAAINTWTEHLVNFLYYEGNEQYLGFRLNSLDAGAKTYTVQIDSITVKELDDCMPPYKVDIDSRPTKAFLTWLPGDENYSDWKYYISSMKLTDSIPFTEEKFDEIAAGRNTFIKGTVNDTKLTLNTPQLPSSTLYIYIVSENCDRFGNEVIYKRPACTTIKDLPFVESFTTYGFGAADTTYSAYPDCWTRSDNNSDRISYPYIEMDSSLYFFAEAGGVTTASLPAVVANDYEISPLQVRFEAMSENNSTIEVGIRCTYNDLNWAGEDEYQLIEKIELTSDFEEYIVEFKNFKKQPGYSHRYFVVFTVEADAQESEVKIKDLTLEETPYCLTPEVILLEVTQTKIKVEWENLPDQSEYEIAFGLKGELPELDLAVQKTRDTTYTTRVLLTPNTEYVFFVRSLCDNKLESEWAEFPVVTLQEPAEFPYSTDFTAEEASNWTLLNGDAKNQWVIGTAAGGTSLYVSNDEGTNHQYTEDELSSIYAYRTIDIPAGPQLLSFEWKGVGEPGKDFLRVFLVPQSVMFDAGKLEGIASDSVPDGWIAVGEEFSNQPDWSIPVEYDLYISHLNEEPLNLVFYWNNNDSLSDGTPAAVRNIVFDESDMCTTPEFISVSQITSTTAVADWISYNSRNFRIKICDAPQSDPETADGFYYTVNDSDPPFFMGGLEPDTEYFIYVRSNCDGEPKWSSDYAYFKTLCEPQEGLFEEFDNAVPPACWNLYEGLAAEVFEEPSKLVVTTEGWEFNPDSVSVFGSSNAKLTIYGTHTAHWLVSPAIKLTPESANTGHGLSFNLALTDYNTTAPIGSQYGQSDDQFMVIISTDEGVTWEKANATIWNNYDYEDRSLNGDYSFNRIANQGQRVEVDLFDYKDQIIRVGFYGESTEAAESNDLHIDSVRIDCRHRREIWEPHHCAGYGYRTNGFNIPSIELMKEGQYKFTRIEYSPDENGCDTTIVLHLTVKPILYSDRYDTICANHPYTDVDFPKPLDETKVYESDPYPGSNGCDSIVRLHLTVYPYYERIIEMSVSSGTGQLPINVGCREFPEGTTSGIYEYNCYTQHGCDSIIKLTLIVDGIPPSGIDDLLNESLSFIPNPVNNGERVDVSYTFTENEREGLIIEVFNSSGLKISSEQPVTYPVSVKAPAISGMYMIRITTGTGNILIGKLIVN